MGRASQEDGGEGPGAAHTRPGQPRWTLYPQVARTQSQQGGAYCSESVYLLQRWPAGHWPGSQISAAPIHTGLSAIQARQVGRRQLGLGALDSSPGSGQVTPALGCEWNSDTHFAELSFPTQPRPWGQPGNESGLSVSALCLAWPHSAHWADGSCGSGSGGWAWAGMRTWPRGVVIHARRAGGIPLGPIRQTQGPAACTWPTPVPYRPRAPGGQCTLPGGQPLATVDTAWVRCRWSQGLGWAEQVA